MLTGFSLTSANYGAAVQLLKKRYEKDSAIERTHLNFSLVYNDTLSDCEGSRMIETHYRGLEALFILPLLCQRQRAFTYDHEKWRFGLVESGRSAQTVEPSNKTQKRTLATSIKTQG